jgi:hypothetical protein
MSSFNEPPSGRIPYSVGVASVARIPIPGTGGLCIELRPRGFVPKSGSTSTLFLQDITGKRHLRLDYGYNIQTKTIDYHWNQKGTNADFGIQDHTTVGRGGAALYKAAKYFRYGGRVLLVVGIGLDVVSIVVASSPLRRSSEVVGAWALAWTGCKVVGRAGAALGTVKPVSGNAIGGIGGCIIGGYFMYKAGEKLGGVVYDWGNATFSPVPQIPAP